MYITKLIKNKMIFISHLYNNIFIPNNFKLFEFRVLNESNSSRGCSPFFYKQNFSQVKQKSLQPSDADGEQNSLQPSDADGEQNSLQPSDADGFLEHKQQISDKPQSKPQSDKAKAKAKAKLKKDKEKAKAKSDKDKAKAKLKKEKEKEKAKAKLKKEKEKAKAKAKAKLKKEKEKAKSEKAKAKSDKAFSNNTKKHSDNQFCDENARLLESDHITDSFVNEQEENYQNGNNTLKKIKKSIDKKLQSYQSDKLKSDTDTTNIQTQVKKKILSDQIDIKKPVADETEELYRKPYLNIANMSSCSVDLQPTELEDMHDYIDKYLEEQDALYTQQQSGQLDDQPSADEPEQPADLLDNSKTKKSIKSRNKKKELKQPILKIKSIPENDDSDIVLNNKNVGKNQYKIKMNLNSYNKNDLLDSIILIKSFLNQLKSFYLNFSLNLCNEKNKSIHDVKLYKFSKLVQGLVNQICLNYGLKQKKAVELFTIIRSPFVYKKTREQFGRTLHENVIILETDSKVQQELIIQMINLIKIPAELKIEL